MGIAATPAGAAAIANRATLRGADSWAAHMATRPTTTAAMWRTGTEARATGAPVVIEPVVVFDLRWLALQHNPTTLGGL